MRKKENADIFRGLSEKERREKALKVFINFLWKNRPARRIRLKKLAIECKYKANPFTVKSDSTVNKVFHAMIPDYFELVPPEQGKRGWLIRVNDYRKVHSALVEIKKQEIGNIEITANATPTPKQNYFAREAVREKIDEILFILVKEAKQSVIDQLDGLEKEKDSLRTRVIELEKQLEMEKSKTKASDSVDSIFDNL